MKRFFSLAGPMVAVAIFATLLVPDLRPVAAIFALVGAGAVAYASSGLVQQVERAGQGFFVGAACVISVGMSTALFAVLLFVAFVQEKLAGHGQTAAMAGSMAVLALLLGAGATARLVRELLSSDMEGVFNV